MSLAGTVARNALFKGTGELLVRVLSFAFVVLVARTLQENDFGILNFALSFPMLFIVLADFGFNPLLIREASRSPERTSALFGNFLILKTAMAALYLGTVFAALHWLAPGPAFVRATWLVTGFILCSSFTDFITAVFQARQQMQLEAVVGVWQKLSLLLLGLAALGLGWGLLGVAGAYLVAGVLGLAAAAFVLARKGFVRGALRLDLPLLGFALREALPLTLTTLFVNLYFRIDMTILAKLRPAAEVGWYGAAHKCIEVGMFVPAVLTAAAFPGFSALFREDRERLARAAHKLMRLLLALGLPLAAGAWLLGRPLMVLVFGPAFAPAGDALAWLTTALAAIFMNYPLSFLLISGERQRSNAVVAGLAAAVSVAANLWWVPRFGFQGAAAAALVTEFFLLAGYAWAVHRKIFPLHLGDALWRIALATAIMALAIWALRPVHWAAALAGGVVAYVAALWLVRAVKPEDLETLRRLLPGANRA